MKRKLIFKYFLVTNCQTEFMRCNWICRMQLLSHTFEFCALKCTTQVLFMVYLYSSEIKWKIFQKYLKISKFFSSDFLFLPQTKSRQRIALFQVVPETIVVKRQKEKAIGGGIKVMTMTRKRLENIHIICILYLLHNLLISYYEALIKAS